MSDFVDRFVDVVFGGDTPSHALNLGQIAARSVLIYLVGLALIRLGKSRLLSGTTPLDGILAFILGSLLSRGITGSASLTGTAEACAALIALHWGMSYLTCRSHRLGDLIKGHSFRLVTNGEIDRAAMRHSHLSERDLHEQMRLRANVDDLSLVAAAYKERNGEIGVVKAVGQPRIVEIEVREGVQRVRLELGG